jgi:uncharacterized protein YkwD
LRKYAVAFLAIPVLLSVVAGAILRRSIVARTGVALSLGAMIGLGAIGLARPATTVATAPTQIVPLTQAAFQMRVGTDVEVGAPVTIRFSAPMDRASVEASITVDPAAPVAFTWSADDAVLTVAPRGHWAASTYYTISVQPGALARSGRPSTTPARAAFLTRPAAVARIRARDVVGKRVSVGSTFTIAFDQAVDPASVTSAVRLEPAAAGKLRLINTLGGAPTYVFAPTAELAADATYRLVVDGVRDAQGAPVQAASLAMRTIAAPAVVRFRPGARARDIARDAAISVRFSQAMDHASTRAAFSVTVAGARLPGTVRFAEGDTVLVFDPASALPYGAKAVATVAATAHSATGAHLASAASATFQTVAKPVARKTASKPSSPRPPRGDGGGGGSVGGGSWAAVERYYLRLMNCTRTGGWVTSTGACSSPGGRGVAPLSLSSRISTNVSRPYAKLLATRGICNHFIGGNPGDRLRRAGYTNYDWAENLGCRSGNPFGAVLGSHRFFQDEKPYSGGHYVNLMNAKYNEVGIGVWVSSGRVRLVVDFYHP